MCVCVCPWRLALQKEGWRQQMDGIRTVSSSCLLFRGPKNGAKNRPQKRELQYCRKKERLPKWRPRFWDQGVAYTVSPPLRAVSSGDSGTFRLFSLQRAWQSFIQVSHTHTHIYIYVFFPGQLHCFSQVFATFAEMAKVFTKHNLHLEIAGPNLLQITGALHQMELQNYQCGWEVEMVMESSVNAWFSIVLALGITCLTRK